MIRSLLNKIIAKFEQQYDYDATYMREINEVSTSATLRLLSFQGITNYRGNNVSVWGGAALAATLYGDCGPCAQLMVDRLLELDQQELDIQACLEGRVLEANDLGLGFQFARAVLANDSNIEPLAERIRQDFGQETVIAAAYAAATYMTYPLLKRALGHAQACQILTVGDVEAVQVDIAA